MNTELQQSLRIVKFETRYVPKEPMKPDLGVKEVDYVITAPRGMGKYTETPQRVIDVQRMTNGMWEIVEPHYTAWKKGQTIPDFGTPLAAWNGVNNDQADILRAQSIRTVEELAMTPDTMLDKLGMGMRTARDAAKRWVAAADTRDLATAMAEKDDKIEELQRQMTELMSLMGKDNSEEPIKRRPGRPRKDETESEAA